MQSRLLGVVLLVVAGILLHDLKVGDNCQALLERRQCPNLRVVEGGLEVIISRAIRFQGITWDEECVEKPEKCLNHA